MADDANAADTADSNDAASDTDGEDTETNADTEDGEGDDDNDLAKQLEALQADREKLEKEVERLVQIARKADQRAKNNDEKAKANAQAAAELERIKRESMSELERAVADARAQAKADAMAEFGETLVEAEFRAAAAGRMETEQLEVLVSGLNLRKFLGDDGKVNRDEVARYVDSIAPSKTTNEEQQPPKPKRQAQDSQNGNANADIGQGAGRGKAPQDLALNGDGIFEALQRAVGNSR